MVLCMPVQHVDQIRKASTQSQGGWVVDLQECSPAWPAAVTPFGVMGVLVTHTHSVILYLQAASPQGVGA